MTNARDILGGIAIFLFVAAVIAWAIVEGHIRSGTGRFTDAEQLRTASFPPPPPPAIPRTANVGQASYDKPRPEMLALPRGDQ